MAFDNKKKVTKHVFVLNWKGAKQIKVCGSFNSWDKAGIPMKDKGGLWTAEVDLAPGRYEYKYIVDGKWHADPATERVWNDLGSENSVVNIK